MGLLLAGMSAGVQAQTDQTIYTDSLQNGWLNWGWTSINYNNASPVHSGTKSISVTITQAWQAIYIAHASMNSSSYASLSFWIHGGTTGGQQLLVQGHAADAAQAAVNLPVLTANDWQQVTVPLASLGLANRADMDGFWIQDRANKAQPTFYLDDIVLVSGGVTPPTVTLTSPASGASYVVPANVNLAATVTPDGHTITKVQFYSGTSLVGEDTTVPYAAVWTNAPAGTHNLIARVVYDAGSVADSSAVGITVTGSAAVAITVDAARDRHPISPLIYGVAFASSNELAELNAPLNRWGGNSTTRYNWHLNADNKANDWYFQSIGSSSSTPGAEADSFIRNSRGGGAEPMLTVPMIGWMPRLGNSRGKLASYSIAKYGPQTGNDWQWFADAGNGVGTNSAAKTSWLITTNNPDDANFLTNSAFQQAWIRHLTNRWGLSTNGGVRYYCMDNEHTLWHSTHRDVHPVGTTMQEIRDKFFDYGEMVKSVDPGALLVAPEEWGWPGYLYSGYDWQWAGDHRDWNPAHFLDRATNGGWDYLPWLLDQARQRESQTGQRLLDVFSVHIYPQGGESGDDTSTPTQLLRNRSTRSLWDTNYVDESWINNKVMLLPRLKGWVASYYPGTKIGITEYNWGAEDHINGATAQADILGIFGREGLDYATRWTTPAASTPTFKAMKMFRNYDGNKSTFGDTSVAASGPNPDSLSTFAALRSSDSALTVLVINKLLTSAATATITLTNFLSRGTAQIWQLTSANAISRLSDVSFTGNSFSKSLPAQSVTLFVLPGGSPPSLTAATISASNTFEFLLSGLTGQRYAIQASSNLAIWVPLQTNTLSAATLRLALPVTNGNRFYRAQWVP